MTENIQAPKIFARTAWLEGSAVDQLRKTTELAGMEEVVGHADLHISKPSAVGIAAYSKHIIHPNLIGNDIGCGVAIYTTNIPIKKLKLDRLIDKMNGLDNEWNGNSRSYLEENSVEPIHVHGLGTIGGGNHFLEFQKIISVQDQELFNSLGIDADYLVCMVHTGSRSYGESIFWDIAPICGNKGLEENTDNFDRYTKAHNNAVAWAAVNRKLAVERMLEKIGGEGKAILDIPHNFLEPYRDGYLHRKGSSPSNRGIAPLLGSRGTPSFLINPISNEALSSIAHGAGRKSSRANMHGRIKESPKEMIKTPLGGIVICGSDILMQEEHHSAYKNIEHVLTDIKEFGLGSNIATLHPIITYKSERTKEYSDTIPKRDKEDDWRRERHQNNRKRR